MKWIYISVSGPWWVLKHIDKKVSIPAYKFNHLLIKGLKKNNVDLHIPVLNMVSKAHHEVMNTDLPKRMIEEDIVYDVIPFYNSKIRFYFSLADYIRKTASNEETIIVCDALVRNSSIVSLLLALKKNIKTVGIITDLPHFLVNGKNVTKDKISSYLGLTVMRKFDYYVLLTEEMNKIVNKKNKPYTVIEGVVDLTADKTCVAKNDKKICFYAGAISKKYGIELLVKAFLKADFENSELHIYGAGDFAEELKKIQREHSNIKYFGIVSNDEILKLEKQATLLVNPRPCENAEFTKYSFPSKNLEYMLSGTPLITTKLPGMPKEYYPHVYLIEEETEEYLAEMLKKILSLNADELEKKGKEAQRFVLENKNNVLQTKKIINMVKDK